MSRRDDKKNKEKESVVAPASAEPAKSESEKSEPVKSAPANAKPETATPAAPAAPVAANESLDELKKQLQEKERLLKAYERDLKEKTVEANKLEKELSAARRQVSDLQVIGDKMKRDHAEEIKKLRSEAKVPLRLASEEHPQVTVSFDKYLEEVSLLDKKLVTDAWQELVKKLYSDIDTAKTEVEVAMKKIRDDIEKEIADEEKARKEENIRSG